MPRQDSWGRRSKDNQAYPKGYIPTSSSSYDAVTPPTRASKPIFHVHGYHTRQLQDLIGLNREDVVLVNVDAHDDWIEDDRVKSVTDITEAYLDDPDSQACWVYVATKFDLVEEVIWVVPNPKFETYTREELTYGLEEVSERNGEYHGKLHGKNVTVTTLDKLDRLGPNKSVVLSVDEDFLGEAEEHWYDPGKKWIRASKVSKILVNKIKKPLSVSTFRSPAYMSYYLQDEGLILEKKLKKGYNVK